MEIRERNLAHHRTSQCYVRRLENGVIEFISYTTKVITATPTEDGQYELECTDLYSQTTRRHIGWFLSEYFDFLNFYDIKEIAGTTGKIKTRKTGGLL